MNIITKYWQKHKEEEKQRENKIMKDGHDKLVKEYETKYENKKVLISNGLIGRVKNWYYIEKYVSAFGGDYQGYISTLLITIDAVNYNITIDDIIGYEVK